MPLCMRLDGGLHCLGLEPGHPRQCSELRAHTADQPGCDGRQQHAACDPDDHQPNADVLPSRDGLAPSRIASLRLEGREEPGAALRGRCGRRSMRFSALVRRAAVGTEAGRRRSEGRYVAQRIKGVVEDGCSHNRGGHGLSCHVAKAMTADGGNVRFGRPNGRARGGRGRHGYRGGAGRSCKGWKIVKQRNDERQRQAECQRPAPKAPTCGFAHDRLRGEAGSFHCKPLRTDEISPLGDVFKVVGRRGVGPLGGQQRIAWTPERGRLTPYSPSLSLLSMRIEAMTIDRRSLLKYG